MSKHEINRRELLKSGLSGLGLAMTGECVLGEDTSVLRAQMRWPIAVDAKNPAIQLQMNACNRCGGCRMVCQEEMGIQQTDQEEGKNCIYCGQCTLYCPTGARTEKMYYSYVAGLLDKKDRIKIASIAPSLRTTVGEMYQRNPGTNVQRSLVHSLRKAGFDHVLDLCFSADVTVMEEAKELVDHIARKSQGPLFTSCCPSWTRYADLFYPEMTKYISRVKSPMMIQGALVKSWFAREKKIDPSKIDHVVFMPCTAKKYEMFNKGYDSAFKFSRQKDEFWDIDCALTTRETSYLLAERGISDLEDGPDGGFDSIMGQSSGAGRIFGGTGGVMEAALRTAYWLLNKKDPPKELLDWEENRSVENFRSAQVDLGKIKINAAVVHGIPAIKKVLDEIRKNENAYDFVEVMVCPGGCVGGGGQPLYNENYEMDFLYNARRKALFASDRGSKIACSAQNPEVIELYHKFINGKEKEIANLLRYN